MYLPVRITRRLSAGALSVVIGCSALVATTTSEATANQATLNNEPDTLIHNIETMADDKAARPTSLSREEYRDRLHAMWLGQTIANWTGLQTELDRTEPPFYTDEDWDDFGFVTDQDPWLADDDTDIEYVYLHTAAQAGTPQLSGPTIAEAWKRHINDFIWVSNARTRELIRGGTEPPATGMGMANQHSLAIDAQLTTEFFGAFAPSMPERALELADLPIRTTAEGHALHASQFFVLLHSLAPRVEGVPEHEQPEALIKLARQYIPDTSKAADIVDFVLADFRSNPDIDDWEATRDRIYERYQRGAEDNGFRYISAVESSVNFAAGIMAFLYGEGDYRRTIQIGTLSGWDSDNATATLGGLFGLLRGTDYVRAQFPDADLADRYNIYRTRDDLPDYLPADPDAEDTLTAMADRMIPLVEQTIVGEGGSVHGGQWQLPDPAPAPDPANPEQLAAANPAYDLYHRSANHTVRLAGGTVQASSSATGAEIDGGSADPAVLADGAESDFSGAERFESPRYFTARGNGDRVTLTVEYDRSTPANTVRVVTGPSGDAAGLHDVRLRLRNESGRWVDAPQSSFATELVDGHKPHQVVDVHLGRTVSVTGVRLVGAVDNHDRLAVAEIDALAPASTPQPPVEGPVTLDPRTVAALPGTTVELDVAVANTGIRRWSGKLDLQLPTGWTSSPRRVPVRGVRPGDTRSMTVDVRVPDDAEPGNQRVAVDAKLSGVDLPPASTRVVVMDKTVSDVNAHALEGTTIELSWADVDPDSQAEFRIYGSTDPDFEVGRDTLLEETAELNFAHTGLALNTTWYYRIVPVDDAGNAGAPSKVASATSGDRYLLEAELLLPPVEATKPAVRQSNCCNVEWSGGEQIWFQSNDGEPGDHLTLEFNMPQAGTFDLSAVYTKAPDFGIHQLSIDGSEIGAPVDAYAPKVELHPVDHGRVTLDKGRHTITLTVIGKHAQSSGHGLGIDVLELSPV